VTALPAGFALRAPRTADVAAVAALEAQVFSDPWPAHMYGQELGQPLRFQRVITNPDGYVAAYLFSCWQVDELHVLKVATHPLYEGRGLATVLLDQARCEAEQKRGRGILLEVRPSNRRAFELYRWLGYDLLARRPRYYSDGEDALVMFLDVNHHDPAPARLF
jgi:ribosomal-protein-alanine N-acetyltransferase